MKIRLFLGSVALATSQLWIPAYGQVDATRTVVSIDATRRIAEESSQPFRRMNLIGEFSISRRGPTNNALSVYIAYTGSATYGVDYPNLPILVSIPAGATSTTVRVEAKLDSLPEPIETLMATLSNCPPDRERILGPCFDFDISPAHGSATIFLRDDGITEASIALTRPKNGDTFAAGESIAIDAVAIDLNSYISEVDFFDDTQKIGESRIYFITAPPAGSPIEHHFTWTGASVGTHVLTARSRLVDGTSIVSAPVRIEVGRSEPPPPPPLVRIEATGPVAEEDSAPLERLPLVGEFTISRTGSSTSSLPVFLHISGTATPGKDYPALPFLVSIPAGATSIALRVEAIPDAESEGIETVVAQLSNCPPDTKPPLGIPCYFFEIDPAHASATVSLRDNSQTRASLVITHPADGEHFEPGEVISVEATAVALDGYIAHVAFFDGDRKIGESQIDFIREPDPGTPIFHQFDWAEAGIGPHVLTARAITSTGVPVASNPVRILVGTESNRPPAVTIVRPLSGETLSIDQPIVIAANARDPDGYVPKAEFFADGRKLGEVTLNFLVPPPPGETQSFEFVWRLPEPGPHRLLVRVTDHQGASGLSNPVEITVASSNTAPVVTVSTRDGFASEPEPTAALNQAVFAVRRSGPTNTALTVKYSLGGVAENGVDYEKLSEMVTIPAGRRMAPVVIRPLSDDLAERYESVIVRLEPSTDDQNHYLIGRPSTAEAVISDQPWPRLVEANPCQRLDLRCTLVAFEAEAGFNYRVEASEDLRSWETIAVQSATESAVVFIDDDATSRACRFYRISPETVPFDD
jgi:hypothetical protein